MNEGDARYLIGCVIEWAQDETNQAPWRIWAKWVQEGVD